MRCSKCYLTYVFHYILTVSCSLVDDSKTAQYLTARYEGGKYDNSKVSWQ